MIVHFGNDLMMASSIGVVARNHGVPFRSITSVEKLLEILRSATDTTIVVVNLQTDKVDPEQMAGVIAPLLSEKTHLFWFAQHVYPELLDAARKTGVGGTLTRGQLSQKFPGIVAAAFPNQ